MSAGFITELLRICSDPLYQVNTILFSLRYNFGLLAYWFITNSQYFYSYMNEFQKKKKIRI
jgi:hypothetical protein